MLGTRARPRLVAIEDQAIVQALLSNSLAAKGFEVVIARDAGAALDLLRQQPAAAVLLDTSMRLDEAWAFACTFRHIQRAARAGHHVPVIAFSAFGGAAEQVAEVEVDDVLPQALMEPRAIDALVDVLTRHMVVSPARPARGLLSLARKAQPFRTLGLPGLAAHYVSRAAGEAMRARYAFSRAAHQVGLGGIAGGSALQPSHA